MTRQLELDINRPAWHETDYRTEVSNLWDVRRDRPESKVKLQEKIKKEFAAFAEEISTNEFRNK